MMKIDKDYLKNKKYFMKKIILILLINLLFLVGCQNNNASNINEEEINEIDIKEYEYIFNPHVISKEYLLIYGDDIKNYFFDFCDAILLKKDSFICDTKEKFYQLLMISNSCFPLALELINKDKTYIDNGICHLIYNYDYDELDNKINEFKMKVTNFINDSIKYECPDYIKAMELYTNISNKNKYDYSSTLDNILDLRSYRSIMNNIGICQEIASEYIYYLLQVGINGITCSSLNKDDSEAHEWVLINLDGKYYHIDPTYAINYPNSLFFFALDDIQREYYGDLPISKYSYANSDLLNHEQFKADDRKFEKFWLAKTYEIDYINKIIKIVDNNTEEIKEYRFDE